MEGAGFFAIDEPPDHSTRRPYQGDVAMSCRALAGRLPMASVALFHAAIHPFNVIG